MSIFSSSNLGFTPSDKQQADRLLALALALAAVLIFRHLGEGSIDYWDEALTAGRSLALLHNGDVLRLSINNELSMRKPPLMYVLNAGSMALLGINEFGLRLPNAVFALLTFIVTASIAGHTLGRASAGIAALTLTGADLFIGYSREALTDTAFVFGLLLAAAAALAMLRHGRASTTHQCIFAIGIAIALLGKGLLALILPLYALLFFACFQRSLIRALPVPIFLAILPMAIWIIAAHQIHPDFFDIFFRQELLERVDPTSTYLPLQLHGPFWYLQKLTDWYGLIGIPALALTLGFLVRSAQRQQPLDAARTQAVTALGFMAGFVIFYIVAISCASHKRDAYLLPAFPLLAILFIGVVQTGLQRCKNHRRRQLGAALAVAAIALSSLRSAIDTRPIPDYRPHEKAVALALRTESPASQIIATDDAALAGLLHFYLDRIITVQSTPISMSESNVVFVTSTTLSDQGLVERKVGPYSIYHRQNPLE